jgi:hypothetical protein
VTATLYRFGTGGTALGVFHQRNAGTRSIILDRAQLQKVTPGTVTLTLERKVTTTPAERPAAGGKVVARFGAPSSSAQVVD